MSFDISIFDVDEKAAEEGVWFEMDGSGDAAFLIAKADNPRFRKAWQKLPKGTLRMMQLGTITDEMDAAVVSDLIAEAILLNWRGIEDDGKPVPYSKENAKKLLVKYGKPFRDFITAQSEDMAAYHRKAIEEDTKNSSSASDGN